jgi:hypothetical protein
MLGVLGSRAFCMELPRGITSEEDSESLRGLYIEGWCDSPYVVTNQKEEVLQFVTGDSVAEAAVKLFGDCKYWHLVDYCEDHLPEMNNVNAQLFREALILLAPHLDIGNYTQRIVGLIGDPTSITESYFQNRQTLYSMFCWGAAENSKRGYVCDLIEICISICEELEILADLYHWQERDQFAKIDVRDIAYGGSLTEDYLSATATSVWPNLPDALT